MLEVDCDDCDKVDPSNLTDENISDWLVNDYRFGYSLDQLTEIIEDYDNDVLIRNENTDDQIILDLSKENWKDHPERERESEKMMKLVSVLDNGRLYIDLKRNLVFV